jgi:DNA polymerase II small subunit
MTDKFQSIIRKVLEKGYQISYDAFLKLQEMPLIDVEELIDRVVYRSQLDHKFFLIDLEVLQRLSKFNETEDHSDLYNVKIPLAKRIKTKIEIPSSDNEIPLLKGGDYLGYFNSRYKTLERILKKRVDIKESIPLSQALKLPIKSNLKTIGMVTNTSRQRNRLFFDLEDQNSKVSVLVSKEEIIQKGLEVLNDQVICIDGFKYRDNLFIANDLIWPDIPLHKSNRFNEEVCVAFMGDIHIGSKWFREDLFEKFIKWINLNLGAQPSRNLASKVKYIVITGDLVDGIGIYPNQINELTITTQKEQYKKAAELLTGIPDYVEIIIIPGNHDAVRRSLPQPPIPKKYALELIDDPRIHLLSNPCAIKLHGIKIMLVHGKALDDILSSIPGYNFHHPIKGIELMLKCRLVAPIYGQTTPIAPERIDRLIIKEIPDVLAMGHIHIYESKKYKGVTLISSGSFQDQTPFQRRMKLKPTPGLVSVFNLKTHQNIPIDFEKLN